MRGNFRENLNNNMASTDDKIPNFDFFDGDLFDFLSEINQESNDSPAGNASQEKVQETGKENTPVSTVRLDDEALTDFVEKNKSKNTKYKNNSDKNIWIRWCEVVGESRNLEDIPPVELDKLLSHFWLNIKRKNGKEYEPDSLTSFQRTFDRLLREKGKKYSLLKDPEFEGSRQLLASKRKQLKQLGKGGKPQRAEPLTEDELEELWQNKQLGNETPMALLRTIWMNFTMHFGMRARNEHYKLRFGDVELREDETGEYVIWLVERGSKTRTGENENIPDRLFSPRMYGTGTERCPVKFFKLYSQVHRPAEMRHSEDPFYLQAIVNPTTIVWFKKQRLGVCSLSNFMKSMAEVCNLAGRKTNHSARKTMITVLRNNEVPPIQVAQLSGHRNLKSLDSYWAASKLQQKKMSTLISRASDEKAAVISVQERERESSFQSTAPASTVVQPSSALQGMFSNASISHSSIQIFTNYPGNVSI